ncbi:MAG: MoxR family ATPase [Deltaproteobacteria bacterium]|nr:MoxR family ATPase [Deltaproteobacteria bacterium]
MDQKAVEALVDRFRNDVERLRLELGKVLVGQEQVIQSVLICLFAGGHALLEGLPGLGKTTLIRALADSLDLKFNRLQFTPDLMPADVTGSNLIIEEQGKKRFDFRPGPVFTNILLADEINRATPKTQSALLEAMQEGSVSVGLETMVLEKPFLVLATQNPIDLEGTYPLPEAQLDRFFFKVLVKPPGKAELNDILVRTTSGDVPRASKVMGKDVLISYMELVRQVPSASKVTAYAAKLVSASRPDGDDSPKSVRNYVRFGPSPRGAQSMLLGAKVVALFDGRFSVEKKDIRKVAVSALRHRMVLNFEADSMGVTTDQIIQDVLERF